MNHRAATVARLLPTQPRSDATKVLSDIEIVVMKGVADGKKLTAIALELYYSDDSGVDEYLRRACHKAGIPRSTAFVTQYALKNGITQYSI